MSDAGMDTEAVNGDMTIAGPISREARRLEELSLNASGAFQSLLYDGWLLGFRPGPTKRLRCVNAFYSTSLPLAEKVDHCVRFYRSVNLAPLFRMLPFSQPPDLDSYLESVGWRRFERTLVLCSGLPAASRMRATRDPVEIVDVVQWVQVTAGLLDVGGDAIQASLDRARAYPLPQIGAIVRRQGEAVACGVAKLEGAHVGLFAVNTAPAYRRQGLGRAIVGALLAEASRQGSRTAYLQVTADNESALELYRTFGFTSVSDYWYRQPPEQ